jgi:hypothetical protein
LRGRVAEVPAPKVLNPAPKVLNPAPKPVNPPPKVGNPPPKAANPPPKAANPPPQPPSRPSQAVAKPANGGETKAKPQLSHALTRDAESLLRKLNGAARDIVEVVDSALPRDLERRFTAGEGDVYTHHLLENRVARLPHIIERRYKAERVVRTRVDAYMRLFERVLDTFAETPQGDQLVDASLASESGKLYLLLARASGRISPQ